MREKKSSQRRTKVQNLNIPAEKLSAGDLKKVKGGLAGSAKELDATTQSGGPTAALNQKIQE